MLGIKNLNLVIFGIGNVGGTLVEQINAARPKLEAQHLKLNIPVVTNSRLAFFINSEDTNNWECDFENCSVPYNIQDIIDFVHNKKLDNLIAVDATASRDLVNHYELLVKSGFHIVSANKIANTLSYDFYESLRATLKAHNKYFMYETNVGAGLPVIETVRRLCGSGEEIKKIRGVFSGSLSYIFNAFSDENIPFSKVLKQALDLGLTEPDAREDLSGNDVARKLLILARELNLKPEIKDIRIESLVPKQLNGKTTLHQFNTRIGELDGQFLDIKSKQSPGHVLRYVGELDVAKNTLEVKLVSEAKNSSIGQLKGADSVFEIYSDSYNEFPLVIRGAGAGKNVTARGLLCDIIKLSESLSSNPVCLSAVGN